MSKEVKYIDFKVTSWERVWLKDTDETTVDSIIAEIKEGLPFEEIPWDNIYNQDVICGPDQMHTSENDGQSTVEMYDENGKLVWLNGFQEE